MNRLIAWIAAFALACLVVPAVAAPDAVAAFDEPLPPPPPPPPPPEN